MKALLPFPRFRYCFRCFLFAAPVLFSSLAIPACALRQPPPHPRSEIIGKFPHDGLDRTYRLHLPATDDPGKPTALLVVLHGGGGSGEKMEHLTLGGFNRLADTEGFVVVYPDAARYPVAKPNWNDGRGVEKYPAHRDGVDDVGFLSALIEHLAKTYGIDRGRVYVTGASNGAIMAFRLACESSDRITAIAPVIGSMAEPAAGQCAPSRPVSVLMISGTEDPLVPWEGGPVRFGRQRLGRVLPVHDAIRFWVRHNKCDPSPRVTRVPDIDPSDGTRVVHETYDRCGQGTEVALYRIEGGGHTWPGGYPYAPLSVIGATSRDLDGSRAIWEFFREKSR